MSEWNPKQNQERLLAATQRSIDGPEAEDEVQFTVTYNGSRAEGRMEVRDLAPAMLSMAHLVEHSAQVLYGATAGVKVEVNADFKEGSFSFDVIAAAHRAGRHLLENLSIGDVLGALGVSGSGGLFWLIKRVRGREPLETKTEGSDRTMVFHDGDQITVNVKVHSLYLNNTIRQDVEGTVAPLKKDGYSSFKVSRPDAPNEAAVLIEKGEEEYFEAPPPPSTELQNRIQEEIVEVVSPVFKDGYKWQLALAGGAPFHVRILDENLLGEVRRHERQFGAGDALRVDMRTVVTRDGNGALHSYREVVRVIEKIEAGEQTQVELFDQPADDSGSPYQE